MLAMVSPVMVGAAAASPQPSTPASDSIRTNTFSACATVSPAICTGFFIGRLTASGSMALIFTLLLLVKCGSSHTRTVRPDGTECIVMAAYTCLLAVPEVQTRDAD